MIFYTCPETIIPFSNWGARIVTQHQIVLNNSTGTAANMEVRNYPEAFIIRIYCCFSVFVSYLINPCPISIATFSPIPSEPVSMTFPLFRTLAWLQLNSTLAYSVRRIDLAGMQVGSSG